MRSHLCNLILILVTATAARADDPAAAQDVAAAQEATSAKAFSLANTTAALEFTSRYNRSSITPKDQTPVTKYRDTMIQELVNLGTHGYVLSEKFFEFDASGSFGLEQHWESLEGQKSNGNEGVYAYDLNGVFFNQSQTPLNVSANRTIDYTSQPFSETYRSTSNTYETTWNLNNKQVPSSIRFYHGDVTQESLSGQNDYQHDQNTIEWHSDVIFSANSHLNANYNFTSVTQTNALGENFTYNANTLDLVHSYTFGKGNLSSLTSTLNYTKQQGDFEQERFRVDENLLLHHTAKLETFYQYQFEKTHYPEVNTTLHHGQAGFRDRLFDNLLASGAVGGQKLNQEGADSDEIFANLNFDYSRKVPAGVLAGLFTGLISFGYDHQQNDAQNTESHVVTTRLFDASQQVVLPYVGITSGSVALRSPSGIDIYSEGIDYTVVYNNDRAVIERIPGGAISDNSAVLIDYDVDPRPANDTSTQNMNLSARYDFQQGWLKGLGFYGHYLLQRQDVDSSQPGAFIPDNVNSLVYGVEYRLWRFRFLAEHEDHDSDIAPFHSDQFSARYEDRLFRDCRIFADATRVLTYYDDDQGDPRVTTMSGNIDYRLSPHVRLGARIAYLYLTDDNTGDVRGLEEQMNVKWTLRDTTIKGQIRHSDLDNQTDKTSSLFFALSIERSF